MKKIIVIWLCSCLMASVLIAGVGNVEATVATGITEKLTSSSQYIKASSDPVAVFGFGATADAGETLAWVNVTFTGTNWTTGDLLPLDLDSSVSGVGLYNDDSNVGVNDDVFDAGDTPVNPLAGNEWITVGGDYCNLTTTEFVPLAAAIVGNYHWFVIIRTNTTIGNEDTINATIETNNINLTSDSQPGSDEIADPITADTIVPIVEAGSNEVRNAVFNSTSGRGTPASVADTGSGIDMCYWSESSGNVWWTAQTSLDTDIFGIVDGSYTIHLSAFDNAGNWAWDGAGLTWDTNGPVVNGGSDETKNALFYTESAADRATPASASDATSSIDNYTWSMDSGPGTITLGAQWDLNTSVSASLDGTYVLNLTVTDNATNVNTDTFDLTWDTLVPTVTTTTPIDVATGVAVNAGITVVFDESMNTTVGNEPAVTHISGGPTATFTFASWSTTNVADDTATFTHDGGTDWNELQIVSVGVSGGQDIASNLYVENYFWNFTIGGSPTATPDPADGAIDVSIMQNYTLEFSEPMNTGVDPSIEPTPPDPANASWAWDGTGMWCNYTYTGPGGPPFLWDSATKYWVNLTGIVDADDGWEPSDIHFNFTTDADPPVVYDLNGAPLTQVSTHNPCDINAKINDTGMIMMAGAFFMGEAGGNATLDNYTWIAQWGGTLTPTGDPNVTAFDATWNATTGNEPDRDAGYLTDGAAQDYLEIGAWLNGTGDLNMGADVYFTNLTYTKVEAELQFCTNGTPFGLWIEAPISEWLSVPQFNYTMTIIPRVEIVSFYKSGELASTPGVTVYGEFGHEFALPDVYFVRDHLVPNGDYPWFVMAMDGGMNIGFNMSETPVSVDNTQPTASTTPVNGATNITTTAGNYAIHFSEPMDNTTGFVVSDLPNVSWNWSNDGRWFNTSYNELEGGKRYELLLGLMGNEFKDLAGNLLLEDGKNKNFTTGKPWAIATGPVSTGTNNNTPTITYDFGNNATEVGIYTTNDGGITWNNWGYDDTVDGIWVPTGAAASGIGSTGTYQWSVRAHGSIVGVDEPVPSGAASIECGDYVLDMDGPRVNSTIPANWDYNINRVAGTYVIEFDEPMDTSVGTVLSTLPGISWDWDSTGMWLNGTYTVLAAETIYYVNLTGQGFVDLVGNALTGQTDMEFKTERSPWAVAGGQTSEGTDNPRPWISYSATGTTGVEIYYTDDDGTTWTLWGTDDNSNGSWTPSTDLPASGTYNWNARALGYVNEPVPSGAASIESGDYVLLSTVDTAYITSTTPADGATSVGLNAGTYIIRFNKVMDNAGSPLSDLPGATWDWSSNGMWLNGTYNALSASTTYYVNLTGQGFQSTSGFPLIGDLYRIFTTRAADETSTGTVIGQVTDEDGNPIAGATVTIPGTDITATTNETGWYVLEDVPEGDHTLEISHPDYGTQEVDVSVTEGETETAGTEQLPPPSSVGGDWTWIIIIIVIVMIAAIAGVVLMLRGKKQSGFEEGQEEKAEATEPEESASSSKQAPPPED